MKFVKQSFIYISKYIMNLINDQRECETNLVVILNCTTLY